MELAVSFITLFPSPRLMINMVSVTERQTEFSEQPFYKPSPSNTEERDLSKLKKKIGTAKDFVIFVGFKFPYLVHVDNRSLFIKKIQEEGCTLPERSIDRAIRLTQPFFEKLGIDTGKDKADTMEADHKIVFGGMKV